MGGRRRASLGKAYFRHLSGNTPTVIKTGIAYLLMVLLMALGILIVGRSDGRRAPGEEPPKKK